jgi:uroporphyrinogen III methyltransferase/synthase
MPRLFGIRVCAIGPATADALLDRGIRADVVPAEFKAEGWRGDEENGPGQGSWRGPPRRGVGELTRRGAIVDVVPAYRTVRNTANAEELRGLLRDGRVHAVTFTSSSTVRYFLDLVGEGATELLRGVVVASIGPITAETAAGHGIVSHIVPESYTIPALVDALIRHFRAPKG